MSEPIRNATLEIKTNLSVLLEEAEALRKELKECAKLMDCINDGGKEQAKALLLQAIERDAERSYIDSDRLAGAVETYCNL